MPKLRFSRALVKISGEVLVGSQGFGIDLSMASRIAAEVKSAVDLGAEIALVIGGGNIFRGIAGAAAGLDRARADYMGMLATVMNALAMQGALDRQGLDARVMSAIPMPTVCEPFQHDAALDHLRHRRVVLFAAGTGNPYFTTDTAATLRAVEIGAEVILKATRVDGVYDADPEKEPAARRYEQITYTDLLSNRLEALDATAVSLAMDNEMPIVVFDMTQPGNIVRAVRGEPIGTLIGGEVSG
jgi:uridylate kinase